MGPGGFLSTATRRLLIGLALVGVAACAAVAVLVGWASGPHADLLAAQADERG